MIFNGVNEEFKHYSINLQLLAQVADLASCLTQEPLAVSKIFI